MADSVPLASVPLTVFAKEDDEYIQAPPEPKQPDYSQPPKDSWDEDDGDGYEDEVRFNLADDVVRNLSDFVSHLDTDTDAKSIVKLHPTDTIFTGLTALDPSMVSGGAGQSFCCCGTTIMEGQIGCATRYGKTFFFKPGNYGFLGHGVVFYKVIDIEGDKARLHEEKKRSEKKSKDKAALKYGGSDFRWKNVTYLNVLDSNLSVVQLGKSQLILNAGRYVLRDPVTLYGRVNIQDLVNKKYVMQLNEEVGNAAPGQDPRDVQDVTTETKLLAGSWELCGSVTFVRAAPGFCWVSQNVKGRLASGIGLTVLRGGEQFVEFVDRQNYARTTRTFCLESADRQEVLVRAQVRWRLENAKLWLTRKGTCDSVFAALEAIIHSVLRNNLASLSYDDCRLQAVKGFESLSNTIKPRLAIECESLGGRLLGFEIRTLRFPLLERRNIDRAKQEATLSDRVFEEKRQLHIEVQNRLREKAEIQYQMRREKEEAEHQEKMQVLKDTEELKTMKARAELDTAKQTFLLDKETLLLQARLDQQLLKLKQAEEKLSAKAARDLIEAKGAAESRVHAATLYETGLVAKSNAQASTKVGLAKATADSINLVGATYSENPTYFEHKLSEINADIQSARADALGEAMQNNTGAILPPDLQKELTQNAPIMNSGSIRE